MFARKPFAYLSLHAQRLGRKVAHLRFHHGTQILQLAGKELERVNLLNGEEPLGVLISKLGPAAIEKLEHLTQALGTRTERLDVLHQEIRLIGAEQACAARGERHPRRRSAVGVGQHGARKLAARKDLHLAGVRSPVDVRPHLHLAGVRTSHGTRNLAVSALSLRGAQLRQRLDSAPCPRSAQLRLHARGARWVGAQHQDVLGVSAARKHVLHALHELAHHRTRGTAFYQACLAVAHKRRALRPTHAPPAAAFKLLVFHFLLPPLAKRRSCDPVLLLLLL